MSPVAKKRIRTTAVLLLAMAMVAAAELTGEREVIFPELVALAVGLWIVDKRVWIVSGLQLVVLMTLGAAAGLCLSLYAPFPQPVNFCLAFAFAGGCLVVSRTTLVPLVSACLLPVLLHTDTWVYPASVFLLSLTLVAGRKVMERLGVRQRDVPREVPKPGRRELALWLGMLLAVACMALLADATGFSCLVLPPLAVTFVEMVLSKAGFRYRPVQVFLLLISAAAIGTAVRFFGCEVLHLPLTVAAFAIAGCLLLLFEGAGKYFAPAGALAFIPLLLPREALVWLPVQAAVGGTLFIAVALIGFMRCYRWPRAQLLFCLVPAPMRKSLSRPRRTGVGGAL